MSQSDGTHTGAPEIGDAPRDTARRRLVNWLLGTSAGALAASILYPILVFLVPPEVPEAATHQVEVGPLDDPELLEKGFKIVRFGTEPVIVIRVSDTDVRAFAATCTHLDCIVEFRRNARDIWCNCHNGQYDLTGRNIAGPPPRPLSPYEVALVAERGGPPIIVVSRS